jgi:hypothetical protein
VALIGIIVYSLSGWQKSGEPFDFGKFLNSLVTSGIISVITAGAALYTIGLNIVGLLTAFFLPWGINTAIIHSVAMVSLKPTATPTCPLTGTNKPPTTEVTATPTTPAI